MFLDFYFENEKELEELKTIIKAQAKIHFAPNEWYYTAEHWGPDRTRIEVNNSAYFDDLEMAKERFYSEKDYLKDFVSEIKENLSFVPKIEAK